jgi:Kelch motif protein
MNTIRQAERRLCLTALLVALAVLAAAPIASAAGTWTTSPPNAQVPLCAPVPGPPLSPSAPTEGMQVGDIGDEIIATYGYSNGDTNLTRIYDIAKNTWRCGTAGPPPVRSEGAAVTHGGFLYAVGGRPGLANLDRYDPASDTWVSLSSMPTGRGGLAAAVVGNAIYAIGGRDATGDAPCTGTPLATVERYNISTDTWSTVASLPSPRSDLAAVAHGGKIYVFGGCTGDQFAVLPDVDVYNPTTDTWSTAPADMPTARSSMYGAAAKGNRLYVIGGQVGFTELTTNEFYTVPSDSWATDTARPTGRAEMGVVSHGGLIWNVGGGFFGGSSDELFSFKP